MKAMIDRTLMLFISISFFLLLINNPVIESIRNYKDSTAEKFLEKTKGKRSEFYNLESILVFDDAVYCLNSADSVILVLSKKGKMIKMINLPYREDKGVNVMYIMKGSLCIKDKKGNLYQYSKKNQFQKITLYNQWIKVYDAEGEQIAKEKVKKQYDEILLFQENGYRVYYNHQSGKMATYYKKQNIDVRSKEYEELVDAGGKKEIRDKAVVYKIGILKNKVIQSYDGKTEVLYQSNWIEFLMYSQLVSSAAIISFLLCSFLKWKVLAKFIH